jgi:hypothetical protein
MSEQGENVELVRRQSLEAVVIKACACGAPGAYHSDPSIKASWPGCWVEDLDPLNHQPVGETCPNCGAARPANKPLGEIWHKEWWGRFFIKGSR